MSPIKAFVLTLLLFAASASVFAQTDSISVDRKRLQTLAIAAGVGYTTGLLILNHVWYKDTERQSFHFFNDNSEWKQVDKAGHFFSSFHLSDLSSRALRSCNIAEKKGRHLRCAGRIPGDPPYRNFRRLL